MKTLICVKDEGSEFPITKGMHTIIIITITIIIINIPGSSSGFKPLDSWVPFIASLTTVLHCIYCTVLRYVNVVLLCPVMLHYPKAKSSSHLLVTWSSPCQAFSFSILVIFIVTSWDRHCYPCCFLSEKTEAQELHNHTTNRWGTRYLLPVTSPMMFSWALTKCQGQDWTGTLSLTHPNDPRGRN